MTKEEAIYLLYRACCLYADACDQTPDWIQIMANANPKHLEAAAEMARDDDSIEETGEI